MLSAIRRDFRLIALIIAHERNRAAAKDPELHRLRSEAGSRYTRAVETVTAMQLAGAAAEASFSEAEREIWNATLERNQEAVDDALLDWMEEGFQNPNPLKRWHSRASPSYALQNRPSEIHASR